MCKRLNQAGSGPLDDKYSNDCLDEFNDTPKISNAEIQGDEMIQSNSLHACCDNSTEQPRSEMTPAQSNEQSRQSKPNRAVELEASNKELRATLRQREDFVAALSHDLKNHFIGETRILELLMRKQIPDDRYNDVLSQMLNSTQGMLRTVWNLLDVYRYDTCSIAPSLEPVNVRTLLWQCLDEFLFTVDSKRIKIETHVGGETPVVLTDKNLLRRVLINVIDNAVKFTPDDGTVGVSVDCSKTEVTIVVNDSGPGMTEVQRTRIFQRFGQTKHGREKMGGSGLGLFVSKQMLEAMGATIECESAVNAGTRIIIKLPR